MKALTLIRPWDQAILHAGKRIENRNWAPPMSMRGQRFAIHSGLKFDEAAVAMLAQHAPPSVLMALSDQPGRVVGVATLDGAHDVAACDCVHCCGPWAFGPIGWILSDVRALAEPVRCRGAQKLWDLPPDVEARVLAQIGAA